MDERVGTLKKIRSARAASGGCGSIKYLSYGTAILVAALAFFARLTHQTLATAGQRTCGIPDSCDGVRFEAVDSCAVVKIIYVIEWITYDRGSA